jgi:hypothetical protein
MGTAQMFRSVQDPLEVTLCENFGMQAGVIE